MFSKHLLSDNIARDPQALREHVHVTNVWREQITQITISFGDYPQIDATNWCWTLKKIYI